MITVYEAFSQYCEDRELIPPSNHDLRQAGALIATHFRYYWGLDHPEDVISAGFKLSTKEGCLVIGYPVSFLPEMYKRIEYFLQLKKERMDKAKASEKPSPKPIENQPSDHKKKGQRTRKPVPEYTTRKK